MPPKNASKKKSKAEPKSKTSPPKDCSKEEYSDLLETANSLTEDEARAELIDCARYGELDAVRALLEVWSSNIPDYVNTCDANGTTALHKSAASGHVTTVQLLLYNKSKHMANKSGRNTPLHWAAANGHDEVVELILNHNFEEELDVLAKNDGGRSALTEGFSSKNTKLVGMLLEHDSASEEKLLSGGKEVDADTEEEKNKDNKDPTSTSDADKKSKQGIIHEFDFLRDDSDGENNEVIEESENIDNDVAEIDKPSTTLEGEQRKTLLIRELPIKNADSPFGDTAIDDTTGLSIWCASLVMARWMASKSQLGRFDDKNVLELGAGCGVPGLALGMYSHAKTVYITDFNPATIDNVRYNIDINANRPSTESRAGEWLERVKAASIDWGDESTWPKEKIDYVIGSDLIYQKSIVPLLKKVVSGLIKDSGSFLYTCPTDGRDGLIEFIATMKKEGFYCASEEVAPKMYRANPLSNGDAEDAFLHFYELPVTEYKLYEFKKKL